MKSSNLAFRFILELLALAALAYWGATTAYGIAARVALAVALPLFVAAFWGTFIAPRARVVLPTAVRMTLGLVVFAFASAALMDRGYPMLATIFIVVSAINVVLMLVWKQDRIVSPRSA